MRTDPHRPGTIVPYNYAIVLSYTMPGSDPFDPPYMVTEARALCESVGWTKEGRMFGHMGKCGVCGAHFRHGDIWRHVPTGHLVHLGHDCAAKYELFAEREDWCAWLEAQKRNRAARIEEKLRDERLDSYTRATDGMREILATDHPIIRDLVNSIRRWGSLTPAQERLARNIHARSRQPVVEEKYIPAPEGRMQVRGTVVSKKNYESRYGVTTKITVKVVVGDTCWLAWGTIPSALSAERGDTVEFVATLSAGRDAHFAIFKRPTKAVVVTARV